MSRRLSPVGRIIVAIVVAFAGVAIPTCGPALLASALLASGAFWVLERHALRHRRPEYFFLLAFAVAELLLAAGIAASHGPRILLLVLLAGPTLLCSASMPRRGAVLATGASALLMIGVAFLVDASGVAHTPPLLVYPLAVLLTLSVVASVAQAADVSSRATAFIDPLTGVLNRPALFSRVAEVTHQARLTGEPIAVVIADVDHFKRVNDDYGHSKGDAVLTGVAARLREELGAQESIFRFGGEEFVVLAPCADVAAGTAVAEAIRNAVRREPIEGLRISISAGVCASSRDRPFEFQAVFEAADRALYDAKNQGRDRVCVAGAMGPNAPQAIGNRFAAGSRGEPLHDRRASRYRPPEDPAQPVAIRTAGVGRGDAEHVFDRASTGNWLVPDESARAHMLDVQRRVHRVRMLAYGLVFLTLAIGSPWYGLLPLAPPLVGAVLLGIVVLRVEHLERPEFVLGGSILLWFVANAAGFLLAHGSPLCALPMLVILVFVWSPAFPTRGVAIGAAVIGILIVITGAIVGGREALSNPIAIGVPIVLLAIAALVGSVLGRSAVDHRSAAVVDQLTGLLIRQALESRIAELAQRVAQTGEPVTAMIGDVDEFKQINDREGHSTGDVVLSEVAYRIRKSLRAFESVYRLGGDEFVVLLAGTHGAHAAAIAERIRRAINEELIEGLRITMSIGAAATAEGEPFEYGPLFERADRALLEAKRNGRDRVCFADAGAEPTADAGIAIAVPA